MTEETKQEVVKTLSQTKEKKPSKWTKEYMRDYQRRYMRERWRRINNVKPENFQTLSIRKDEKEAEILEKYGEKALEYFKDQESKKKKKEKPPKPPKQPLTYTTCSVCLVQHFDSPGFKRKHENTQQHKYAVKLLEAHTQQP